MSDLMLRLRTAVEEQRIAPLEMALAEWALRHAGDPLVALTLACCARAVAEGHSCLDLRRQLPALPDEKPEHDRQTLLLALQRSPLATPPGGSRPLIVDGERLYLQRYWRYEHRLAENLATRLSTPPEAVALAPLSMDGGLFDYSWLAPGDTHWQAVAAFVALRNRFTVISGGPGTGKTYTVLRLLRLLIEAAIHGERPPPVIRLAAPTGKAAARMLESIRVGLEVMPLAPEVEVHIPQQAQTLHRLLGIGRGSTRPRHDAQTPLAADVLIIDEASMIDLPMMAKLSDALPSAARLILLGDRYQLASVESGSVLAELCKAGGINAFSQIQQQAAGQLLGRSMPASSAPLADHVVTLQTSHRFQANSPIGCLAAAVNAGEADQAITLAAQAAPAITRVDTADASALDGLIAAAVEHFAPLHERQTPARALGRLQARCILCAVRHGPFGVQELNRRISQKLAAAHDFDPQQLWYHGRPVMIVRNDYRASLYNGDVGICLRDERGHLRVWFQTEDGLRPYLPSALPANETVYAMTVHKSQGSEFTAVTLVLPAEDSPVLSRELLYTGITRARERVVLYASDAILRLAIGRRTERDSGLAERLRRGQAGSLPD